MKIYVKPAEGLTIPQLDGKPVPADGCWMEPDAYVRRRLKAGDLLPADPPATAPAAEVEEAETAAPAETTETTTRRRTR